MAITHVQRGDISEFIRLVAETFGTDHDVAEAATGLMLVRLFETPHDPGVMCLFDNVPGSRDLVFAHWMRDAPTASNGTSRLSGDANANRELFTLFLTYCSAHAGVDCASRILAASHLRLIRED